MNTFSNSLLTFLFGWARSLIEGVWSAAAEGKLSGFLTWLGDHWLGTVLLIVLICTVLDFLVWMIRWRPYLVWRSTLRRLTARLRGEKVDSQRRFSRGYQEGVDIEISDSAPIAPQAPYDWMAEFEKQPIPQEETAQPEEEEAPAWNAAAQPAVRRRRRSEKHEQRPRIAWHPRFPSVSAQDEDGLLDGLPPAVSKEQAFRDPVYPTAPRLDWQNQPGAAANGKNT